MEGCRVAGREAVREYRIGSGELLSDSRVLHRYWLEDGLVVRMDVLEPDQ